MNKYKVGDIIKCVVTGILKYGFFVRVDDNYTGLVHISEISDYFIKNINDYVSEREVIYCRVLEINEEEQQLKLSIKNINYKSNVDGISEKETRSGFLPLKEHLDEWINEKLEEYRN